MPAPTYLAKNRHGGFLFRIKIPTHLIPLFAGKKAITKSLQTYHRPTALKLARRYAMQADDLFYKLDMKSTEYRFKSTLFKAKRSLARGKLSDLIGDLSGEALNLIRRADENEDSSPELDQFFDSAEILEKEIESANHGMKLWRRKAAIAHKREFCDEVYKDMGLKPAEKNNTPISKPDSSLLLADAMLLYIANKEKEIGAQKAHPDKAIHRGPADSPYRGYTASFRLLLEEAGNIQTSELGLSQINRFKILVAAMKNANHREVKLLLKFDYTLHKFVKPLPEILEKLAKIDAAKLAQKTIIQYFSEVSTFLGWLGLENEYLAVDTCHRMQKALSSAKTPKSDSHAKEKSYNEFSIEQLQKLFAHPKINPSGIYRPHHNANPLTPADFWMPLLALFTGARGRELAQLFTDDIHIKEDIWCISIKPEESIDGSDGKAVKTESSKRLVPIHQTLIDAGLLQFHYEQKLKKEKHLFPQLRETQTGKTNPYKSWGQNFRRDIIQKHLGIPTKSGEVFHSFRSTLITELERQGVDEAPRKQLAGHSKGSDAHARYSKGQTLERLQTLMNKAAFDGLDFTLLNWEKYKAVRLS